MHVILLSDPGLFQTEHPGFFFTFYGKNDTHELIWFFHYLPET